MEAPEIVPQIKHYSHSPLHRFITGSERSAPVTRSRFNPYRRPQGLATMLGLKDILEELDREEEATNRPPRVIEE